MADPKSTELQELVVEMKDAFARAIPADPEPGALTFDCPYGCAAGCEHGCQTSCADGNS